MSVTYDPAVTYVVYSSYQNINPFNDVFGNTFFLYGEVVTGESVTYQCNETTIIPNFNFSPSHNNPLAGMNTVILGTNCSNIIQLAFYDCSSLTTVIIQPSGLTSISDYAFFTCSNLSNINIGNGVTSIGEYAFLSCVALTSITIPDSVTYIGLNAFSNTRLATVYIATDNKLGITSPATNVSFFGATVTTKLPTPQISDPGDSTGKSNHTGSYKLGWSGVDPTGDTVTGTYTGSVSSTGNAYAHAHDASSEKIHDDVRAYLKNNVTNKYKKVHYTIQHTSAL